MKQIGFKNFRKFADFPAMDLAPITVLVGENNAGKSTVVKGILALTDFLNERTPFYVTEENPTKREKALVEKLKNVKFYFNSSYLAHIGTFKRALYNNASNNTISFFLSSDIKDITIDICGDKDNDEIVSGIISRICIDYPVVGLHIEYDLYRDSACVTFSPVDVQTNQLVFLPAKKRSGAKKFLSSIPHSYEFKFRISDFCRNYLPDFIFLLEASVEIAISAAMEFEKTKKHIGAAMVNDLKPLLDIDAKTLDFLKKFTQKVCPDYQGESWMFILPESIMAKKYVMLEYIYAHAVSQSVIYSAKDTNDYLSKTIHEFASIPQNAKDYRKEFIKYWMKEFKIGKDFEITSVGGEAHLVRIIDDDNKSVNLADKGMGSIQLMVLLFRLAITLPKQSLSSRKRPKTDSSVTRIIIIEEPEQNLHPMLQSKLADLFYELNKNYGFRFIIETHSEYLVRRSQVITAIENKKSASDQKEWENPFKVYYFPADGFPYDMEYAKDGYFEKPFGKGFFNVSSELSLDLDRIEQGVYNERQD